MRTLPDVSQSWYPLILAFLHLGLAAFVWPRRRARGAMPFLLYQLVATLIVLVQAGLRIAGAFTVRVQLYQVWCALAMWGVYIGLWFSLEYAGVARRISRWIWVLTVAPIVVMTPLILTNGLSGRIWSEFGESARLDNTLTRAGAAGMIYVLLLALASLLCLLIVAGRSRGVLRGQAMMFAINATWLIPVLLLEIFRGHALAGLGWGSLLGLVPPILTVIAIFRFRAFDLIPIARDALIEQTSQGMLVLDDEDRILDVNPAARRLLGAAGGGAIGKSARAVFSGWPELLRVATDGGGNVAGVTIPDAGGSRYFEATVSPFLRLAGGSSARLVVLFDVTEQKLALAEIERQRAALAGVAERERVARELHDGLAQALGSIKLQAQAAQDAIARDCPEEAFADLGTIQGAAHEAHAEIRDFLAGVRATGRQDGDLPAAVAGLAERYAALYGLIIEVSWAEAGQLIQVAPGVEAQLLWIVREALTNVRKHAGVTRARIDLEHRDGLLQITIRDDGAGFEPDAAAGAKSGHYGLSIMRERAAEAGATVEIESSRGRGTAVFIAYPFDGKDRVYARAPRG